MSLSVSAGRLSTQPLRITIAHSIFPKPWQSSERLGLAPIPPYSSPMTGCRSKMSYSSYLKLDQLLSAQTPVSSVSGQAAHHEMFFIIIHQAYELWFKQILHEIESLLVIFGRDSISERNIGVAVSSLARIIKIQKLLVDQVKILETLTPLDFLDFRGYLPGASGFQSVQFRLIENRLGLKREQRVSYGQRPYCADFAPEDLASIEASEQEPTLFDGVERWLERTPFLMQRSFNFLEEYRQAVRCMISEERAVLDRLGGAPSKECTIRQQMLTQTESLFDAMLDQDAYELKRKAGEVRLSYRAFVAALFIQLYRDEPILQLPFQLLSSLLEIEENLRLWRFQHSMMVLRMLGSKIGTGGSSGHSYLSKTVDQHAIFSDLFALSSLLVPRTKLPPLGAPLESQLDFHYSVHQRLACVNEDR